MIEYNKSNIPLAQKLRKSMTPWERKLWYEFLSQYPVRFQRQKAIGDYIVDFYCAKARLVVELDGGGHYLEDQTAADALRTQALEQMGLRVVRICNLDIDKNFRGVCEFLNMLVQDSLPQSASLTAPSSEGALVAPKFIFALGFFDGVHLGHQALIEACVRMAGQNAAGAAAITFDRHPQSLFATPPVLINSIDDRIALMREFGVGDVLVLPASKEVMSTSWQVFLQNLLDDGAVGFVCGDDFRFGCGGEGTAARLAAFCEENGLPCEVIPEQKYDNIRISSTHIRALLESGDVETAAQFLGHPHTLSGKVMHGRQLGRTIGIPTANIPIPADVVVPKHGVYATACQIGEDTYLAVTNIGSRPTVDGHEVRAESWLLDFDGDLYGQTVTLHFHRFIRPEQKFASLDELRRQIQRDAATALRLLK